MSKEYAPKSKLNQRKIVESTRFSNLITTKDFPDTDPWFNWLANDIETSPERFVGRKYLEFGIGGGLQAVAALTGLGKRSNLSPIKEIVGVDIDSWRLNITAYNLNKFNVPYTLYKGDAVRWVEQQEEIIANTAIIMCLPQAPLPKLPPDQVRSYASHADIYHEDKLPKFAKKYNRYGLGLNAAVLGRLIEHIGNNVDVSVVFSGRVPESIIRDMINTLGWKIVDVVQTPEPVQQDPDTDISYTLKYAHESHDVLFWEKLPEGMFSLISAVEAERRLVSANRDRKKLNVYHHVAVWHLEP